MSEFVPRPLADVEREHILTTLAHFKWHQSRAAEALGISSKTLYRRIRAYGFDRPTPPTLP
jgi:two-component system NtrC family response regulator